VQLNRRGRAGRLGRSRFLAGGAPESAVATAMAHWLAVEMKMVEMMTPGAVQWASSPAPAPAS